MPASLNFSTWVDVLLAFARRISLCKEDERSLKEETCTKRRANIRSSNADSSRGPSPFVLLACSTPVCHHDHLDYCQDYALWPMSSID